MSILRRSDTVKVITFVPVGSAEAVRGAMAEAGAGIIGQYNGCSFEVQGVARFRPLAGSNPAVGKHGEETSTCEVRIETTCHRDDVRKVRDAVVRAHPWEMPGIEFQELMELDD